LSNYLDTKVYVISGKGGQDRNVPHSPQKQKNGAILLQIVMHNFAPKRVLAP